MRKRYPLNPEYKLAEAGSAAHGGSVRRSDSPLIGRGEVNAMPQLEDLLALAETITSVRARRSDFFSADLFAEPAWEMLLGLYRTDAKGRRMMVSDMVSWSAGPPTTGLRWLNRLEELGMVTRRKNPIDARVIFIELAPETREQIRDFLTQTWVSLFGKG